MRSLIRKDLTELFTARAFWLVLIATTLLVAQAYVDATRTYAEVKEALPSLDGIVTPTAGAYDLAIMLLFPFVAIRLVASEKSSDALKLMLQWPFKMRHHIGNNYEPGRQTGQLNTHAAAPCAARLAPTINFSTAA